MLSVVSVSGLAVVRIRDGLRAVCSQESHVRWHHDRELLEHRDLLAVLDRLPHPRLGLYTAAYQPVWSGYNTAVLVCRCLSITSTSHAGATIPWA